MSESNNNDGCLNLAGFVAAIVITIIIVISINNAIEKRDNYILDLQRRVGQLETLTKEKK